MLKLDLTVGEIIEKLYQLWDVQYSKWPNNKEVSHLEFSLKGFNPDSEEQIKLVSSLCYVVQTGAWETSYSALKRMLPDQEFETRTLAQIKNYFSGADYLIDKKTHNEFINNQRNPFILELLSHVMLSAVEHKEACHPFVFELQGIHYMHLNSKKQGLDLAAIARDISNDDYYLIIGESKNRLTPSQGTAEALDAFQSFDNGNSWPDIRQVMMTVANSIEAPGENLAASISQHVLWQQKIIYRLSIEHRVGKPQDGSQFRNFGNKTPNVPYAQFRQCEAFSTKRLDDFHEKVSHTIVMFIEKKEKELKIHA